jgi:hypothetical protein
MEPPIAVLLFAAAQLVVNAGEFCIDVASDEEEVADITTSVDNAATNGPTPKFLRIS